MSTSPTKTVERDKNLYRVNRFSVFVWIKVTACAWDTFVPAAPEISSMHIGKARTIGAGLKKNESMKRSPEKLICSKKCRHNYSSWILRVNSLSSDNDTYQRNKVHPVKVIKSRIQRAVNVTGYNFECLWCGSELKFPRKTWNSAHLFWYFAYTGISSLLRSITKNIK